MVDRAAARQKQMPGGEDRPARQDHVAELETALDAAAVFDGSVEKQIAGRAIDMEMFGKQIRETGDQIDMAVLRKTAGHFLQLDDIGAGNTCGDTLRIEPAVHADPVLDVITGEFHDYL